MRTLTKRTPRCAQDVKSPNILIREQVSGKRQVIAKLGAHHRSGMLQLDACLFILLLSCEFRVTIQSRVRTIHPACCS